MKVFIETDEGRMIEAREIESVPEAASALIFTLNMVVKKADLEKLEADLTEKTGKKCVILPVCIDKVVGV